MTTSSRAGMRVVGSLRSEDDRGTVRTVAPSGWTPIGLIEHLGHAERAWFQLVLTGQADPLPWPPDDDKSPHNPLATAHTVQEVLDFYRRQCAVSDEALARTALAAAPIGQVPPDLAVSEDIHTARDIVLHMIEETARHAGHLDLARESIDGRTGLGPR